MDPERNSPRKDDTFPRRWNTLMRLDAKKMEQVTFKRVESKGELEAAFKLRYQVYVVERGFEPAKAHPGARETDEFDEHSIHFIGIDSQGFPIGTVRLVKHSPLGFPMQRHFRLEERFARIPAEHMVEISRLAISKAYRNRREDGPFNFIPKDLRDQAPAGPLPLTEEEKVRQREIVLGLMKVIWRESKWLALTDWCCAMERSLHVILKRHGFLFKPAGPEADYHGLRTPYTANLAEVERYVAKRHPETYKFFTDWLRSEQFRM